MATTVTKPIALDETLQLAVEQQTNINNTLSTELPNVETKIEEFKVSSGSKMDTLNDNVLTLGTAVDNFKVSSGSKMDTLNENVLTLGTAVDNFKVSSGSKMDALTDGVLTLGTTAVDIKDTLVTLTGSVDTFNSDTQASFVTQGSKIDTLSTKVEEFKLSSGTKMDELTLSLGTAISELKDKIDEKMFTPPVVGTKTITDNGVYTATNDALDGYSKVTVAVPMEEIVLSIAALTAGQQVLPSGSNKGISKITFTA